MYFYTYTPQNWTFENVFNIPNKLNSISCCIFSIRSIVTKDYKYANHIINKNNLSHHVSYITLHNNRILQLSKHILNKPLNKMQL